MRATSVDSRPSTMPSASMTCQARSISLALTEWVGTEVLLFVRIVASDAPTRAAAKTD
jgi:hypothetical protein